MKLHEHLDELKDRAASENGDHVPLLTRDVIELIEDRNALYEVLAEIDAWSRRQNIALPSPDIYAALSKAEGHST